MYQETLVPAFLSLLLLIGCDRVIAPPVPEPPAELAVTAVLASGDSTQHLLLSRVRTIDSRGPFPYVQGAKVRIGNVTYRNVPWDSLTYVPHVIPPDDSTQPLPPVDTLVRTPDYLAVDANYVTDKLDVRPGRQYELAIAYKGHRITGQVTVPGTFSVKAAGPYRLSWTESAGAALYEVALVRLQDSVQAHLFENATSETTLTLHEDFEPPHRREGPPHGRPRRHPESHGPEAYVVIIEAYDPNMAAFHSKTRGRRGMEDPAQLRAGIEGAYGVFGAVTTIRDTVLLGQ